MARPANDIGLAERATALKITRLTTAVVHANYDYTFVRIETDRDGLYGTGERFFAPGLAAILDELAPLLIGRVSRSGRPVLERPRHHPPLSPHVG